MYGIFKYIYHKIPPNVDKYTIHGCYGILGSLTYLGCPRKSGSKA